MWTGVTEGEHADAAQEFFQWRKRVLQAGSECRKILACDFTGNTSITSLLHCIN